MASEFLHGEIALGRSFESMRMGAMDVSARWLKAFKALKKEWLGRVSLATYDLSCAN
jgi:hypothetical protein